MTQRQQWGVVAGIVLFLAGVLAAGVHFLGDELFPVSVGSKAPPIEGVTLDWFDKAFHNPGVRDALVIAREDRPGDPRLRPPPPQGAR